MPVKACRQDGRPGYKWGDAPSAKCYTYPPGNDSARREAKRKAVVQGIAAGERPSAALVNGAEFTRALQASRERAEKLHLRDLTKVYERAILRSADTLGQRFAVTAAAEWQPPSEGALFTIRMLAALQTSLRRELSPIWTRVILDTVRPLAQIDIQIAWDVKHPTTRNLLEQAARRTGIRLGEAVQPVLREVIRQAYEDGLSVQDTSTRIRLAIADAAPWQADMLARTDLNSLANGASKAAADEAGMSFKTWLATFDDKTRPEHADAHGQTVPIADTFLVGGEDADYPGDPNLSDAMACNCRCTLAYGETLEESEAMLAASLPADKGGIIMPEMATKEQRRRRYERRAAHAKGEVTAPKVVPPVTLEEALVASPRPVRFNGTAAVEGRISDDNTLAPRVLLPDTLVWPEMPVPFMAQTKTAEGHDGAEAAGRVDEFSRRRMQKKMREIAFAGELTTPYGINEIAPMIEDKTLRYVSVDLGATQWAVVRRESLEIVPQDEMDAEELSDGAYALGLTSGKIKAVTLVPTQALEGAMISLVASAETNGIGIEQIDGDTFRVLVPLEELVQGEAVTAAAVVEEWAPPHAWFETQEPPGKMPLTVTEDGRVFGHLATWDSCHVSFLPSCLPPPKSPSNYAYFHVCELDSADGVVTVGKMMFSPVDGGHADRTLTAQKASQYYDRTGMTAAYLRVSDGQHGIWAAGSLNPDLTKEQRRQMRKELRLNPPSGDWRPINGQYELICGLAVAVPGFPVPRATLTITAAGDQLELTEAIIASSGKFDPDPEALVALERDGLLTVKDSVLIDPAVRDEADAQAEREMRVLAARAEGMDALAALVEN